MSLSSSILEGLHISRINESSYEDTPVSTKSREMQKVISDVLNKKYLKLFQSYGAESVGAEVYVHDDRDSEVDDAIYEITVYVAFDIKATIDVKAVEKLITKTFKNYPKFEYDKSSKQFYATCDTYYDIIDIIDTLEKEGCRIQKLYNIEYASDIEDRMERQMREWEEERREMEREYNRSRL